MIERIRRFLTFTCCVTMAKICLDDFVYYVFLYLCFSLCHINVMVQCWVDKHVSFRIQMVKGFVPLFVHLP